MHGSIRACIMTLLLAATVAQGQSRFVNWENPHVHPLDLTPSGDILLAVNTADNRLEVFSLGNGRPSQVASIPVGLDPVSVRARTETEVWVVNHISDSISIVDLTTLNIVRTLRTLDEPADVVFAGPAGRAFISCSQVNTVISYDPANLAAGFVSIAIAGEEPRAMAVSPDGQFVYAAIFESGNGSTILGGGSTINNGFPPNVVSDPAGPYGGQNPPPNDGAGFRPLQRPGNPPPLPVGLIVKKDGAGRWMDDNNHDWTNLVSGPQSARSGRPVGWDLPDHDVAIINADSFAVTYANRLMNLCMAIAVNPASGMIGVVGTDATNEMRFEPVLNGRFLRVNMAVVAPAGPVPAAITDLNPHLAYSDEIPFEPIDKSLRESSIGDPRGIAWDPTGTQGYVTGMGSNNVIMVDADGRRIAETPTITVGAGPTGIVHHPHSGRLYVLNKFDASVSVIDTILEREIERVPFYDPTPDAIRIGRKHLYDTHRSSGTGHLACASCHVDGRTDRLAWDLGDPGGVVKPFDQNCPLGGCQNWHPMKGPMTTQTLQDIIGLEPHHWRGDRSGIEQFAEAFEVLLGDDGKLSAPEMQDFEDFLATIHFPPNPYRNFDNTLPTNLPLPGHYTPGRFAPAGQPLPNGNAVTGLQRYRTAGLDGGLNCVTCHTLPTGVGTNFMLVPPIFFMDRPPGPNGELHHAAVSMDGSTNITIKIPQIRNAYEKVGFELTKTTNLAGFGFLHDGSVDSLARFVSEPLFSPSSDQDIANQIAFMLAFSGSELPVGSPGSLLELPGPASQDTHAAVGAQITLTAANKTDATLLSRWSQMQAVANSSKVGMVAKGMQGGIQRGYQYMGSNNFQSDRVSEAMTSAALFQAAGAGAEITFTIVPKGSERRIGIDRDEDGHFDRDELDACSNPADPARIPGPTVAADLDCDADVDLADVLHLLSCATGPDTGPPADNCTPADLDQDGDVDQNDFGLLQRCMKGESISADPECLE